MAILYVAADAMELEPFAKLLTGLRKLKWPLDYAFEGVLDGKRLMLAANGAGPRLAAQAVEVAMRAVSAAELSSSKLDAVVSTGFCGALDPALRVSQIVLGTAVIGPGEEPVSCETVHAAPEGFATGPIFSQNRIANDIAEKQRLAASGAIAVDMEAAGIAAHSKRAGLPFYCIKCVSDLAGESFGFDLNEMRTTEGRIARGKIVSYALAHPKLLAQLLQLKRRSEDAAKALGDFLVSCRILPEYDNTLAES
jgi:adenosylhomocysteine nucleosidase